MAQRTCSVSGCDAPHRARGLCRRHYKLEHERVDATCVTCGASFRGSRATAKFCSDQCKGDAYRTRTISRLPRAHPVNVLIRASEPEPTLRPVRDVECAWCGASFSTTQPTKRACSLTCKRRAKDARRRGRQYGWASHYTWTEVMRLFILFDHRCAYCEQRLEVQPEPDHVVPLSKGGSNSITNILPACSLCNADKRDLLLHEWATDRARRGLEPRVTAWPEGDVRVRHLTSLAA